MNLRMLWFVQGRHRIGVSYQRPISTVPESGGRQGLSGGSPAGASTGSPRRDPGRGRRSTAVSPVPLGRVPMVSQTASTPIAGPLVQARFLQRHNRFLLTVRLDDTDEEVLVHMADPGRLRELLVPGRALWLRQASNPARKTRFTAVLVETPRGDELVSLDTTLPNRLVRRALQEQALEELKGWTLERAEVTMGRSRLDFLLSRGEDGARMAVEVKSVSLVEEEVALFPDAVTARGTRHVEELEAIAQRPGWQAAVLFVLQRSGAREIRAARSIDPDFAEALEEAGARGVKILGRRCRVFLDRVELGPSVPAGVG